MLKRSLIVLTMSGLAGSGLAGCAAPAGTDPTAAAPAAPVAKAAAPVAATPAPAPSAAGKTAAPQEALPTIPAGARYTIFCESFNGPDHVAFSTKVKSILVANSKLKDWYVIHQSGQSSLYHGYYVEFEPRAATDSAAKRDADRAKRDHSLVESIPNPQAPDQKMFPRSLFVALDAPDPDAPPAWNLTNAPGFWTVQIAAYTGAERKQAAVESVANARKMNVPAFYFHGDAISSVCIGSWPAGAVKSQDVGRAGHADQDSGARDGTDLVVNYSGKALPESMKDRVGPDGKRTRVLEAKLEVLDPTLLQTLKQYPEHAVDSRVQMLEGKDKSGKPIQVPRPSFIVQIPRVDKTLTAAAGGGAAGGANAGDPDATLVNPAARRQDLGARLKGLGR